MTTTPFDRYRVVIPPDWVDYNGHLNMGYYLIAFDQATEVWSAAVEIGEGYRERTGCAIFAVETHLIYRREVYGGDAVRVTTQIIGADAKKVHLFHRLFRADEDQPAAINEVLLLNVTVDRPARATPWPTSTRAALDAMAAGHAALPHPPEAGRQVSLTR